MLDLPRYLLGAAEILALASFAALGAAAVRSRLLPRFDGAPAHLATAVLALAGLIWTAQFLGTFGLFAPLPYLLVLALIGVGTWLVFRGWRGGGGPPWRRAPQSGVRARGGDHHDRTRGRIATVPVLIALAIAALAAVHFAVDVRSKLGTGMTGFDSTWYHAPFAAGFFQSGNTWDLHFIAPQFLAWFYPANAEIFHAAGMLAFGRDVLSPLLNLGWFIACLLACWCIGRPYRVAPWSLGFGAIALSLPVLADQAGEARNDLAGIFFLLAAVAIALNAWAPGGSDASVRGSRRMANESANALLVVGLAAGLAAGTKLNFLLPAAVLVLGCPFLLPSGGRLRGLAYVVLAALAGGGYWYLRNLAHTGNPLPWFDSLGPLSLPAPEQALGGREGHSVLGYLTDGAVWSDWFLPGLHEGLTALWPLLLTAALTGLLLSAIPYRGSFFAHSVSREPRDGGGAVDPVLRLAGIVGLAAAFAWLVAPTSASGPEGVPRGFESGLRYLAPALVLGLAVLPPALLPRVAWRRGSLIAEDASASEHMGDAAATGPAGQEGWRGTVAPLVVVGIAIAIGYPVQRHYLENRYANPTFAAPGLNAAFKWANTISDARIATTSTRQYPLFGADLSNRVQYIGEERPHGGFVAPTTCRRWLELLNEGDYDYVIASRDRIEPGKPPYPPTARWTEGPGAREVLLEPPTVVFRLTGSLDPRRCRH